jgi:SH3-like domain-containing protein
MRRLITIVVLCCTLIALAASTHAEFIAGDIAYVKNPNRGERLNLRSDPSTNSVSLGKYYTGTMVHIIEVRGEWAKVTIEWGGHPVMGYMATKYLATDSEYVDPETYSTFIHGTGKQLIDLREKPSDEAPLIGQYMDGTQVMVMGDVGDKWCHIRMGGNMSGYIKKEFLSNTDILYGYNMRIIGYLVSVAREVSPEATNLYLFPSVMSDAAIYANGIYSGGTSVLLGDLGSWYQTRSIGEYETGFVQVINRDKYLLADLFPYSNVTFSLHKGQYEVDKDLLSGIYVLRTQNDITGKISIENTGTPHDGVRETKGDYTLYIPHNATITIFSDSTIVPLDENVSPVETFSGYGRLLVDKQLCEGSYKISTYQENIPAYFIVSNLSALGSA